MSKVYKGTTELNNIKIGGSSVSKIYVGSVEVYPNTTTTTTTIYTGAGYYDCGYGCQYYTYNPGCSPCSTYYYTAQQYDCSSCTSIGGVVNISDYRSDLNANNFYSDAIGGNNWKIITTGASSGGTFTNLIGSGVGTCAELPCI